MDILKYVTHILIIVFMLIQSNMYKKSAYFNLPTPPNIMPERLLSKNA
jgi:hypothetical protein